MKRAHRLDALVETPDALEADQIKEAILSSFTWAENPQAGRGAHV